MYTNVSPLEVLAHSFEPGAWRGTGTAELNECVGDLLPTIVRGSVSYGDNRMICSLIAIAVDMANAGNHNVRVALILRNCARILEIEGRYK